MDSATRLYVTEATAVHARALRGKDAILLDLYFTDEQANTLLRMLMEALQIHTSRLSSVAKLWEWVDKNQELEEENEVLREQLTQLQAQHTEAMDTINRRRLV